MKKKIRLLFFVLLSFFSWVFTTVLAYQNPFSWAPAEVKYCKWGTCWLKKWVDGAKNIDGLQTEGTFSEFIQNIVVYLLGFVTLAAVIYIMYAGFRILTSNGEDETIKKSKKTIIYVIIGIVVIWFAWSIAHFAVGIWEAIKK